MIFHSQINRAVHAAVEIYSALPAASPARPDMHRRKDLAGQVVRQTTKSGLYDVTYNEDGYAVKARRVN